MNKLISILAIFVLLSTFVFATDVVQDTPEKFIIDGGNKPLIDLKGNNTVDDIINTVIKEGNMSKLGNITENTYKIQNMYQNRTVESIELKQMMFNGEEKQVLEIKETKKVKLFWFFNKEMPVETVIDADNGEVLQLKHKWYHIFAFGED